MKTNLLSNNYIAFFTENGFEYKMEVHYGWSYIGLQEPYFSITADLYEMHNNWRLVSSGCQHDLIKKYASELEPLIKWHLCFLNSGPLHYEANGVYWWNSFLKHGEEDMLRYFKDTVVYGVTTYDKLFDVPDWDMKTLPEQKLREWMRFRLPELINKFYTDLAKYNLIEAV